MNRLKKELIKRNVLYEADQEHIERGPEYDVSRQFVTITEKVIVTVMYSAILDPMFYLYDRNTYELIGQQNVFPEPKIWGKGNTFGSFCWI